MIPPKWVIGIITLFVLFTLISGVIEYVHGVEAAKLYVLMQPSWNPLSWPGYIDNLWDMFWFDYPFFTGAWAIIKYVLFWPISIGVIISVAYGVLTLLVRLKPF